MFPRAGVVQVKDLTLSSDIALHDLDTKLKQVSIWLEKKHHVRLTLRPRREQSDQALVISHPDTLTAAFTDSISYTEHPLCAYLKQQKEIVCFSLGSC